MPDQSITVTVDADTEDAVESIEDVIDAVERLEDALESLRTTEVDVSISGGTTFDGSNTTTTVSDMKR